MSKRECSIDDCAGRVHCRGLCKKHHTRWWRTGSTELPTLEDRLEARIERVPFSDCWYWMGTRPKGYGYIRVNGKSRTAHRVMYELHHGPIPEGMHVLHTCNGGGGSNGCVAPHHLCLGTHRDNMRDMNAAGRNAAAQLTAEKVRQMREARGSMSIPAIAEKYGVTYMAAYKAITGRTWRHVDDGLQ